MGISFASATGRSRMWKRWMKLSYPTGIIQSARMILFFIWEIFVLAALLNGLEYLTDWTAGYIWYLIMGNHDLKNIRQGYIDRFEHVAMQMHITVGKQKIYLNHYPFLCFDGGYKDVWQLFGHVHTRKNNTGIDAARLQYLYPTQYDVGVDNNNYTPVSFEQVKRIMTKQIEKGGQ